MIARNLRYKRSSQPSALPIAATAPPVAIEFVPPTANKFIASHQHIAGLSTDTEHILVIAAAVLGSILLLIALILFYVCMKRRRASRRIGQLQEFLPTFMDKEKTESYFKNVATTSSSSASRASSPTAPLNVHHRTRSAPVAFAKGRRGSIHTTKRRHSDREGSNSGQFRRICLVPEEPSFVDSEDEAEMKSSLSTAAPARARATTVSIPTATTVSSLHRSVSLNHHRSTDHSSRTPHDDFTNVCPHDSDALPTDGLRLAEGETLPISKSSSNNSVSRGGGAYSSSSNRYPANIEFNNLPLRYSTKSHATDLDFDPARFSTTSVIFDAKRLSTLPSDDELYDNGSLSSGDDFESLPAHQKQQNFESHTMVDMMSPGGLQLDEVGEQTEEEELGYESNATILVPSDVLVPTSTVHQLRQHNYGDRPPLPPRITSTSLDRRE
ncbi:hypothetical protein BG004_004332 [Podila humilis]|nr:hypothetical protein BG004_004332 [Podila humilis]